MKKIYSLSMALMLAALPVIAAQPGSTTLTLTAPRAHATINPAFQHVEVATEINPEIKAAPAEAGGAQAITFGYGGEPYNAYYLVEGPIGIGVEFPADYLKESGVVGNQITAINVASPFSSALSAGNTQVNALQACTVFITETLGGTPVVEVKTNLSRNAFEMNTVELPTPYDITGENDVYICVLWDDTTKTDYPIVVDGNPAANDYSAFVYSRFKGMSPEGQILTQKECKWTNFVPYINTNITLSAQVSGDNLPTNRARLAVDGKNPTQTPNEPFEYAVAFYNDGINIINDIDLQLTIDGQDPQTVHASVVNYDGTNNPVEYAGIGMASGQFTCTQEGLGIPYTATITKVNGEDNSLANVTLTGTLDCISGGYPINVVVEEFTSAKCGFCPIGITAMEQTKEKYGKDNRFIPIAVHGPFSGPDNMNVCEEGDSYYDMIASFTEGVGAPSSFVMRDLTNNVYPDPQQYDRLMQSYMDARTIAGLDATLTKIEGDDTKVKLDVTVNVSYDDQNPYGISYTIVEDNVGPYMQTNYYAGGQYGECYGWENKPGSVRVTYNDVARNGSAYNPPADSHVTELKAGEPINYSTTLSLSNVKKLENYSVVAMLINRKTKRVLNATIVKSPDFSGIDGVEAENVQIAAGLTGAIDMLTAGNIYTMDGRSVAVNVKGMVSLPAGIYLVSTPQGNAKVIVR